MADPTNHEIDPAGIMAVADLIAQLHQMDHAAPVLTSRYEGGLTAAHVTALEVQKLDRHGEMDWLGDWERVEEACGQAAEPDGPSPWDPIDGYRSPDLIGEPIVAAVIYRAGR